MVLIKRLAHTLHGRLHYAWVVSFIVVAVLLVSSGLRAATGVLIIPLEQAFGWTRDMVSGPLSVGLLLFGLMGPFSAALMHRFGVRPTVALAMVLMGAGAGLSLLMTEPWHLMATWGALVGMAAGMIAVVLGSIIAARWFSARQGLVLGLFMASMAGGQLVFLPLLAWIAESGGWRPVAWVCAIAGLLVVPLVWLFLPERPSDIGLLPYGATKAAVGSSGPTGNPFTLAFEALWRAIGTRDFWLLGGAFVVCGITTNGLVGTHLIPMCFEAGVPQVVAAGLLATMGVFNVFGTIMAGWASDKWDNRWLLFGYYSLRGVSLAFLPYSNFTVTGLTIFSVIYGLDWLATGPSSLRLLTDRYGAYDAPIIFGWIFVLHQIGAATAAWGAGLMRMEFNGYTEAFVLAGIACIAGALMSLAFGRSKQGPGLRPAMA